jgi:DNA-binding transcriptional LysR family regulator
MRLSRLPVVPESWPDLAVLQLLVAVAEQGSLGAGARQVGMSQPSASRAVTRFERRHGIVLLERSTRGSALTPEGSLLVDWSRELLASASQVVVGIAALKNQRRTQLRVVSSLTVAEYLVPRWLVRLGHRSPEVQVRLSVANSEAVCESVLHHQADLGFVEAATVPAALQAVTVAGDRLVVVVDPAHRWARRRRPLTTAELATTPLAMREQGSGTRGILDAAMAKVGYEPNPTAFEFDSNTAVRICAAAGAAPAVLSALAVRDAVNRGELVVVPVADLDLRRRIRAVWLGGRRPPSPGDQLLACTAE